jgi:CxxC-x17-CxxC domain-containing protein
VYTDRAISCLDCGQEFTFTAGEQEFYAQRGFTEPPKRCPSCRAIRKSQRSRSSSYDGGGQGEGNWSASPSYDSGYGSSYAGASAGYGGEYRERRPREMFEAVCADCGKTASVPFRPSGVKPVYCSDCFQNRR